MNVLFTLQSCLYSLKNPLFVTLGQKCPHFKMAKIDTLLIEFNVTIFFVILNGVRTIYQKIFHDFLIQKKYIHKNVFGQP